MATIAGLTENRSPPTTGGEMSQFDYYDHDGIVVSTMVVLTMSFFTQHGGCNRHRCRDHRLRRGDISSWLPNSPFLDWVSFLNKENIAGHGEVSS